jgi:hypothetical protein
MDYDHDFVRSQRLAVREAARREQEARASEDVLDQDDTISLSDLAKQERQ